MKLVPLIEARGPGEKVALEELEECNEAARTFRHRLSSGKWWLKPLVEIEMDDQTVRVALKRHWDASDVNDFNVEHEIYREDAVLDYPQSGERIRGRRNIQESRYVQPNKKRFTVQRIIGSGDLWVTEFILTYDGVPSYTVSIMEFRTGSPRNAILRKSV